MRKILILLIAMLNMTITLQAYAQSAELTASGGAFEGYSSSSSNIVLSSYGARSMTSGGTVFGQNSQTDLAVSELIHRLQQDVQNRNLSQEDEQRILDIIEQVRLQNFIDGSGNNPSGDAVVFDRQSWLDRNNQIRERFANMTPEDQQRFTEFLGQVLPNINQSTSGNGPLSELEDLLQNIRVDDILTNSPSGDAVVFDRQSWLDRNNQIRERFANMTPEDQQRFTEFLGQVLPNINQSTSGNGPLSELEDLLQNIRVDELVSELECRSPCAIPTGLLGNEVLNDPAYYLDTWAMPPWLTPYDIGPSQAAAGLSQFDARSWISQMPNGAGYSTTTGFPHPYSGLYGPLVSDSYSNTDITFDPLGRSGLPTEGAPVVASLFDGLRGSPIAEAVANGANLSYAQTAALVQAGILPLHFLITWGANSSDLDLHLTGPLGNSRFHIYYAARGSLTQQPNARLIDDCVSASCGEVIRVEGLNSGGVYRASVYNYGDQSFSSTNLSTSSNVRLQVVRGGTVRAISGATDNGSTVIGGEVLFSGSPTAGQVGNTWRAVEVNPNTGDVTFVNEITNSINSASVR